MQLFINASLLHGPDKVGCFIAEASELGLKPGQWPKSINTKIGGKQKFFHKFAEKLNKAMDVESVVYLGEGGGKLTVFND